MGVRLGVRGRGGVRDKGQGMVVGVVVGGEG